jgi:molecular chaperone Hsp33
MLGAMLKDGGSVTATVKGGGPLGTLLAVAKADGSVKGYAENPQVELPRANGKLAVGDAVGRNGRLTVIRDMGFRRALRRTGQPGVGRAGGGLRHVLHRLGADPFTGGAGRSTQDRVISAAGLIVQMMPGATQEAVSRGEEIAPNLRHQPVHERHRP